MKSPYSRIARLQRRLMGSFLAVVIGLTTIGVGLQSRQNSNAQSDRARAETTEEMWKIAAGEEPARSSHAFSKLGGDLHALLGTTDPQATNLPAELVSFRAGPSTYPNINNELFSRPFDDNRHLTTEMLARLLQIKRGELQQVVAEVQSSAPQPSGVSLAPFSIPLPIWIGMVYLATGGIAMVIAVKLDSKRNDYSTKGLNWKVNHAGATDLSKRSAKVLAPCYFVIKALLPAQFKGDFNDALDRLGMRETYNKIVTLMNQLSATDDDSNEAKELMSTLEARMLELETAARRHSTRVAASDHLANLRDEVAALNDEYRARVEAMEEVSNLTNQEMER